MSERRRRERRLRSWAEHERHTVAMALAEALHHSAPRRPKTARAGVRPGVLEDPGPRRETEHDLYAAPRGPKPPSPGVPSLATPLLAGQATEVLDASTLAFPTRAVLEEKKAEVEKAAKEKVKEERMRRQRRQALVQEIDALFAVPDWSRTDEEDSRIEMLASELRLLDSASSSSRSKRKRKRRKKKTPRASSHPTLRRAHRRQRQWYVHGWLCCFGASHAVFLSFVCRTQLLGIMDGMDQNDRTHRALVVDCGSGICKAGCASFLALCSFTLSSGPR